MIEPTAVLGCWAGAKTIVITLDGAQRSCVLDT